MAEVREKDPEKALRIVDIVKAANKGILDPIESRKIISEEMGLTVDGYLAAVRGSEVRNEKLLAYITGLRKQYKIAMLSNIGRGSLEVRFPNGELSQYFDVVVASGEIGYAKPEARAYEITADQLGVRLNECVMIDDRETFCQGAVAVGMQAIQFESTEQTIRDLEQILTGS